jgi:hypothetical protein
MSDITKHDRQQAAAGVGEPTDAARDARVRRNAETLIRAALGATRGKPEIDRQLAIGAACPYSTRRDLEIWREVIALVRAEE